MASDPLSARIISEIDAALARCDELVRATPRVVNNPLIPGGRQVIPQQPSEVNVLQARAFLEESIRRLAPKDSAYAMRLSAIMDIRVAGRPSQVATSKIVEYRAILEAMRFDASRGTFRSLPDTIHAELFNDELGIARHLLDSGFAGSSAVAAGVVLEAHLRLLAVKSGISVTTSERGFVRAGKLNEELRRAELIDDLTFKLIVTWLGIRDAGAHPDGAGKLSVPRVDSMIEGVREFVLSHPA